MPFQHEFIWISYFWKTIFGKKVNAEIHLCLRCPCQNNFDPAHFFTSFLFSPCPPTSSKWMREMMLNALYLFSLWYRANAMLLRTRTNDEAFSWWNGMMWHIYRPMKEEERGSSLTPMYGRCSGGKRGAYFAGEYMQRFIPLWYTGEGQDVWDTLMDFDCSCLRQKNLNAGKEVQHFLGPVSIWMHWIQLSAVIPSNPNFQHCMLIEKV